MCVRMHAYLHCVCVCMHTMCIMQWFYETFFTIIINWHNVYNTLRTCINVCVCMHTCMCMHAYMLLCTCIGFMHVFGDIFYPVLVTVQWLQYFECMRIMCAYVCIHACVYACMHAMCSCSGSLLVFWYIIINWGMCNCSIFIISYCFHIYMGVLRALARAIWDQ